jgi:hypothetical protein
MKRRLLLILLLLAIAAASCFLTYSVLAQRKLIQITRGSLSTATATA